MAHAHADLARATSELGYSPSLGLADWPELKVFYEKVIFERNERMAERLGVLAQDGRLRFAVIGAGHLVGPRGIPALLHAQGFRIQRRRR